MPTTSLIFVVAQRERDYFARIAVPYKFLILL